MIVNLQPRHLPGNHWVAIYRKGGRGFYFDTFGREPAPTIANWLSQNTMTWKHYGRIIQSPNDKVSCGYICMEFKKSSNDNGKIRISITWSTSHPSCCKRKTWKFVIS